MSPQNARRIGAVSYAVVAGGPLLAVFVWQFFVDHPRTRPPAVFMGAMLVTAALGGVGAAFGWATGASAAVGRGRRVVLLVLLFPAGVIITLGVATLAWWAADPNPIVRSPAEAFLYGVGYGTVYGLLPMLAMAGAMSALLFRRARPARSNPPL